MRAQVRGRFNPSAAMPSSEHARRDLREQAGGQPDRADRFELLDLGEHRLEADVPRRRLD